MNFGAFGADGSYTYNLKPTSKSTAYSFRAFIVYKNTVTGETVTVYSNIVRGSYNNLR